LLENAVAFNQLLGIGPDSRFLHVFHMTYMAGFLNTLLSPIMAGSSVVLARAFDAQSILDFWQPVIRNEVNTMWIAPTMAAALVRGDRRKDGVDYCQEHHMTICVGTAPLPQTTKDEFEQKYGVELHESYGLSEILFVTSNSPDIPNKPGSVGLPVPGVTIKISNDRGEAREIGNDGNVWINTPYASVGYLDFETSQPDAFDSKMWFETGDYGHVDDDGLLFITGRTKDQIIRGGINISPRAVEEAILTHSAVDKVAVIGMPHAFYGEEVVAVLLFKDGYALAEEQDELTKICGEYLSKPSIPSKFVEAKEFPISINGKIQKNVLRERLLGRNSDSLSASKLN
jgi:long-chain acyl-CoA synthetase